MTGRLVEGYLEWARLEAGLADGDRTLLGEEHGEREEAAARFCPEDVRQLLLFSGDLPDKTETHEVAASHRRGGAVARQCLSEGVRGFI